ncbi:MAG TPA: outer membrane beta-barrel protein [Hyphomicrobium sp.]|jgi:opacity protein-like surface antigen|nr:outer membrane beta-barrel protein [Hyphomicrobium sp.]
MLNARKVLFLSAALVLGSALSASAADLGGLKDEPEMAPAPTGPSGWYARVDGGYAWYNKPGVSVEGFTTHDTDMGSAWSIGGGIGHYFGRGFRGDVTVDYLFNAATETTLCDCSGTSATPKFDFSSTVVLANLYYDLNRGGRFSPYIGGGVGFAHNQTSGGTVDVSCGCSGTVDGDTSNSFAAAGMAGFSWRLRGGETRYMGGLKDEPVAVSSGHALYLDVGYRFLYLGDAATGQVAWDGNSVSEAKLKDVTAHQIRIGLRYDLN